ncbi:hypothetical protein F5Y04DRAFT_280924 [Hypomontagnella monticulosa]|nr:hypothetical protein F5Y04DRAFT_280924 [Hypomontagnella monticulosa]
MRQVLLNGVCSRHSTIPDWQFENGLHPSAEAPTRITIGAEYRLTPESLFRRNPIRTETCYDEREGKAPLKARILLHPEERHAFDTPATIEDDSGYYLECEGIFSFEDYYLPRAPERACPPAYPYVSPGIRPIENLRGLPPTAIFTCGFDPLRNVGIRFAGRL